MFVGDVLCFGPFPDGSTTDRGAVDRGETSSGRKDPNQYASIHENAIAVVR